MAPSIAPVFRCLQVPILQFSIRAPTITLGRSPVCGVVVGHESISRRHAEIQFSGDRVEILDLKSRNGTFVAGARIAKSYIEPGQIVRFGSLAFAFIAGIDGEEATHPQEHPEDVKLQKLPCWESSLSPAQARVFRLLVNGHSEKAIAKILVLSRHTIHNHTRAIFRKFSVHSRVELLAQFALAAF